MKYLIYLLTNLDKVGDHNRRYPLSWMNCTINPEHLILPALILMTNLEHFQWTRFNWFTNLLCLNNVWILSGHSLQPVLMICQGVIVGPGETLLLKSQFNVKKEKHNQCSSAHSHLCQVTVKHNFCMHLPATVVHKKIKRKISLIITFYQNSMESSHRNFRTLKLYMKSSQLKQFMIMICLGLSRRNVS